MCPLSIGPAQSEAASERMEHQAIGQSSREEVPRSPSRSLQATDVDHHNSPQPSLFQDLQHEVASEVADAVDPVREVGPHCTIPTKRASGRRCVNRFSGRFRIHCSTAGMGRPSVSAHTSWFCCSGFDQRAGHFHTPGMSDEGPSSILRGPFFDADRIARDHFWHGIGQPCKNHERMEIVHPPPQNVVVQSTWGSVHQICTGTVVGVVVCQCRSVENCCKHACEMESHAGGRESSAEASWRGCKRSTRGSRMSSRPVRWTFQRQHHPVLLPRWNSCKPWWRHCWAQNEELLSSSKRQAVNPSVKDRARRLQEDFVPMCDEDVVHWIPDRQADMQDAMLAGNTHELARLCHVVASAASQM